jgi:hypothetical protein
MDAICLEDLPTEKTTKDPDKFTPDNESTWIYWTNLDTEIVGVCEEWIWERLRAHRDALLTESDYRMVTDAPWETALWAEYRQALRDLPETTKDPRLAEWPVKPNV